MRKDSAFRLLLGAILLVVLVSSSLKVEALDESIFESAPVIINLPGDMGHPQFCSQGNSTFALASNGTVVVYSFSGDLLWSLKPLQGGDIFSVSLSPDDRFLAVGTSRGELLLYSISSRKLLWRRFLPGRYVRTVSIASDRIVVGNDDKILVYTLNGSLLWSKSGFSYVYRVKVYRDRIIAGTAVTKEGKNLYELSIDNGRVLESFRVGKGSAELLDVFDDGTIGFSSTRKIPTAPGGEKHTL